MEREIEIPKCVNYADLRQKQEVSGIEEEAIRNYAKSLSPQEVKFLLAEIPDDDLIAEINWRLLIRKSKLERGEESFKGWR